MRPPQTNTVRNTITSEAEQVSSSIAENFSALTCLEKDLQINCIKFSNGNVVSLLNLAILKKNRMSLVRGVVKPKMFLQAWQRCQIDDFIKFLMIFQIKYDLRIFFSNNGETSVTFYWIFVIVWSFARVF